MDNEKTEKTIKDLNNRVETLECNYRIMSDQLNQLERQIKKYSIKEPVFLYFRHVGMFNLPKTSIKELAEDFGCSQSTIKRYIAKGKAVYQEKNKQEQERNKQND